MAKQRKFEGIRIAVIGGGTGPFAINRALKSYAFVSAIPGMWDSGGSTGILRDEMGVLPPGDARQALVSLADHETMRDFFNHRLQKGSYKNHAVGNIFLAGLEELTGSFAKAIEMSSELLNIRGEVVPVITEQADLCLKQANGKVVRGENTLGEECAGKDYFASDPELFFDPKPKLNPKVKYVIEHADVVVICPGKLYTSVGPHLLVKGMVESLQASKAKKVYVSNLMTVSGQTDGFSVVDHVNALEKLAGAKLFDYVVYNTQKPSKALLDRYTEAGETLVSFSSEDFLGVHYEPIGVNLLANVVHKQNPNDVLRRSLIRHNGEKIARLLMSIAFNPEG